MKRIALFCVIAVLAAAPVFAKTLKNAGTGLQYDVPDAWSVEEKDGDHMVATPDEQAIMIMLSSEAKKLDEVLTNVEKYLEKMIQDAKPDGDPKELKINGLPAALLEGKGKYNDQPVHWSAAIVINVDKCLIVLAFGTEDGLKKHQDATVKVFESIKKVG